MKRLIAAAVLAASLGAAPAFAALQTGAMAPDFTATAAVGGETFEFRLSEALKEGPVVVYFFPAAFTPGCTAETNMFADAADKFAEAGATLIGVTGGARTADNQFVSALENIPRLIEFSAEHCRDKFPIGAVTAETIRAYDVAMAQREGWSDRTSYVIAPDGKILLSFTDPRADDHVSKTLEAVKAWKASHAQ